jgi:hypothetical protein
MTAKKSVSQKDLNGLKIVNLGDGSSASDGVNRGQLDTASTADRSRANHSGSQLAATISDLTTAVRLNALDQMAAPTGDLSLASHKLTNVLDPSSAQDAATKSYVDTAVATSSAGLVFKGKVRAVSSVNSSVTSAAATIDGVTPTNGDVFLLTAQTTGSEDGPWTFAGSGAPMSRPSNWDTTAEAVPGSLWVVQQGTYDNQLAIMSTDVFVLGTTTAAFVFINPAAASDNDTGYTATCPAVSAGATWTVTHALGSKAVIVAVYRTASPFDEVDVYVTRDTTTAIGVSPDIAMASGEYTVVVSKVA